MRDGGRRRDAAGLRGRPWVWGVLLVGFLTGLGWVGDPMGTRAVTVDPLTQLGRVAAFTLPATVGVGCLYAWIPGRHVVLRTVLLLVLALYVAGIAAPFVYRATGVACGTGGPPVCATTTASRVVGIAGEVGVWAFGLGAEETVRTVRRVRRPKGGRSAAG